MVVVPLKRPYLLQSQFNGQTKLSLFAHTLNRQPCEDESSSWDLEEEARAVHSTAVYSQDRDE